MRGAGQADLRVEAAAGEAGRRAGQAGWDGNRFNEVSQSVVERLGAHRKACWTFFDAALLVEVEPWIAL